MRGGAVVVARVGNDLFVKRLEKAPDDKWILMSDSHEYAPLTLIKDDVMIGKVMWKEAVVGLKI